MEIGYGTGHSLVALAKAVGESSMVRRVLKPGGRFGTVSMATTPPGQTDSLLERTYKWMHEHFPHIVDCQPIDV
ncbi:MAG: hypothetical protein ABI619_12210, partial [Betaproteobacteria bacterium]